MAKRYQMAVYSPLGVRLCTIYDSSIPQINAAQDISIKKEFNGWKEIAFSMNARNAYGEKNTLLNYMRAENLLYLYEDNTTDVYTIKQPEIVHGQKDLKRSVKANHISEELKAKNLYKYFTDENGIGTCQALIAKALGGTGWTLGNCDIFYEADGVTEKVRSYSCETKTGAYNMINGICELFQARPIFHGYEKTVDIRARENATGRMEINYGKNMDSITRREDSSNLITRLYVEGEYGDLGYVGIDDAEANTSHLPFIFNFDYYKELGLFTNEHQAIVDAYEANYYNVVSSISSNTAQYLIDQAELRGLIGLCGYIYTPVSNGKPVLIAGGNQILMGTNTATSLTSGGTARWRLGQWRKGGSATASPSPVSISSPPVTGITRGWLTINTATSTGVGNSSCLVQDEVPVKIGTYTISCYARGSGKIYLYAGTSSTGFIGQSQTISTNSYTLIRKTINLTEAVAKTGYTSIGIGISDTGDAGIRFCGMMLTEGESTATWSQTVGENMSGVTNPMNGLISGGDLADDEDEYKTDDRVALVPADGDYAYSDYAAGMSLSGKAGLIKFHPAITGSIAAREDAIEAAGANQDSLLESINEFMDDNDYPEVASINALVTAYGADDAADLAHVKDAGYDLSGVAAQYKEETVLSYTVAIGQSQERIDSAQEDKAEMMLRAIELMESLDGIERNNEPLQTAQETLDQGLADALGTMLRDGYWSDDNYAPGQEDSLYADALVVSREMAYPQVTYDINVRDLSDTEEYADEVYELGMAARLYDRETGLNEMVYVYETTEYPDKAGKDSISLKNDLLDIGSKSFTTVLERVTQLAQTVDANKDIYSRAGALNRNGTLDTSRLEGMINSLTTKFISANSNWAIDEKGNLVFRSLDGESAMMLCGYGFMIASSKDEYGNWNWRTFGTGDGFTADEITTGFLSAERIKAQSITVNKLASDVGESLDLSSNTSIQQVVGDIVEDAVQDIDVAGAQILRGTNTTVALGTTSTGIWVNGGWRKGGSASAVPQPASITDAPNPNIRRGWLTKNSASASGAGSSSCVIQGSVPVVPGTYVISCYARGSGHLRMFISGNNSYLTADNEINTSAWVKLTAKINITSTYIENGACNVGFGVDGTGTAGIRFCGMKLARGNKWTEWEPAAQDTADAIDDLHSEIASTEYTLRTQTETMFADYVRKDNLELSMRTTIDDVRIGRNDSLYEAVIDTEGFAVDYYEDGKASGSSRTVWEATGNGMRSREVTLDIDYQGSADPVIQRGTSTGGVVWM